MDNSKQEKKKGITMGKAILKLQVFAENGMVNVNVLKARHLASAYSAAPCVTFVEVSLQPDIKGASLCRTAARPDRHPVINEKFSFELLMPEDAKRRLCVSVWNIPASFNPHLPPDQPQLEFLGCMSFGVHHILAEDKAIDGWYYLLKEGVGRRKHLQAILNSAIYSDGAEVNRGQQGMYPYGNESQHINPSNQHIVTADVHGYNTYQNVRQNCQNIVRDLATNTDHHSPMVARDGPVANGYDDEEEDTYTTYAFTKRPTSCHPPKLDTADEEFRKHGITFGAGSKPPVPPQRPHAYNTQDDDENEYVMMYPPKSLQQNGGHIGTGPSQSQLKQKAAKHVGFSDLVNSENLRGLPESRMKPNHPICHSSPKKTVPDLSEIDTNGYMTLSHVRRSEENTYASIEPLNGSYLNDNASEISEFTYSKSLSKMSRALYPNLKNTPLSSRKLLHIQQQQKYLGKQQDISSNTSQHAIPTLQQHPGNMKSHAGHIEHRLAVNGSNVPSKPSLIKHHHCQHNTAHQQSVQDKNHYNKNHFPSTKLTQGNKNLPTYVNHRLYSKSEPRITVEPETKLSSKSDVLWPENNVHNDSGIGDHESSPKSDGELSDRSTGMQFNYKPSVLYTPQLSRANNGKSSQINGKSPLSNGNLPHTSNTLKALDIQVHDVPRWLREDKSRIVCTNDSCVEEEDADTTSGDVHVTHTPSCPYHVCTSCNGILPEYADHCPSASHTIPTACLPEQIQHGGLQNGHLISKHFANNDPHIFKNKGLQSNPPHALSGTHFARVPRSEEEDASNEESEDDFGYMSMEKFNIYKDTVLKHNEGAALKCTDHETTTKIYFL